MKRTLEPFLKTQFTGIVTFVVNCLPKTRVKSFLEKNQEFGISNINHLFDFMIPKDYTLFGEAIKNNFDDVFGVDYLDVQTTETPSFASAIVVNREYDLHFNHAVDGFPECGTHYGRGNLVTNERFRQNYHLIEVKFAHLTDNSRKAISSPSKT